MLGPDLVRARRRGENLELLKFPEKEKARALVIAEDLIQIARSLVGASNDEVVEALAVVDRAPKEEKLWAGLKKLLLDQLEFGAPADIEPVGFRRALFTAAATRRAEVGREFDRDQLLRAVAAEHGLSSEQAEDALFCDLKGAAPLKGVPPLEAPELVERYQLAQLQGVLLRAVNLTAVVRSRSPDGYRRLFQKLKFRQLLYELRELPDGRFCIEIDGPFSVLETTTKYGLQLALVVPALLECDDVELEAQVRWGKDRRPLDFRWGWQGQSAQVYAASALRPELESLLTTLRQRQSAFVVEPAGALLDVPGVGLVVPDLVFRAKQRPPVYLELLGYWSREAVWRRIEWADADKERRILFAVSSRLRVSEALLDDSQSAALYVFKGALAAKTILERVESLSLR